MLTRNEFIALGKAQKGKPYVLGANGPDKMDCSGLWYYLCNQSGNSIGDTTAAGYYTKTGAVKGNYATGDTVYRATNPKRYKGIGHMAVMLYPTKNGDWAIIEARGRKYGVVLTTLSDWQRHSDFMGVRRLPSFTLAPDKPVTPPVATPFTIGFAAQESPRFGGSPSTTVRGIALAAKFKDAAVIGVTETTLAIRNGINDALGTKWTRVKESTGKSVATFYDTRLATKAPGRREVPGGFGDNYHGAICQPVIVGGHGLDIITAHIRPKTVATAAQKRKDVAKALSLVGTWPAILMGDWSMDADVIMRGHGFTRATPHVDTYDGAGTQRIDAIYYQPDKLTLVDAGLVKSGTVSDHDWLRARFKHRR